MEHHFQLMWEFEGWANRRTLESIHDLDEPEECVALFAHILAAQRVWLTRLQGRDSAHLAIFPTRTVEQCVEELRATEQEFVSYLASLSADDLDAEIEYAHQSGKEFHNTRRDILTHLGMHSHYHRGQIAARVRAAGSEPAITDFIAFRRQGQ